MCKNTNSYNRNSLMNRGSDIMKENQGRNVETKHKKMETNHSITPERSQRLQKRS